MAVTWVTFDKTSLASFMIDTRFSALIEELEAAVPTAVNDIVTSNVNRLRQAIGRHQKLSGTALTIPPGCVWMIAWMSIGDVSAGAGSIRVFELSDAQKKKVEQAEAEFERIAEGKAAVEEPTDAVDSNAMTTSGITLVTSADLVVTRDTLNGM